MVRCIAFTILFGLFILLRSTSFASSGHVIVELTEFNEKQIDSLKIWFATDKNIVESGFCKESNLLLLRFEIFKTEQLDVAATILKSHGLSDFHMKEEISLDRFYQNCQSFISFQ